MAVPQTPLRILSWGRRAKTFVAAHRTARVLAVFDRSVHLCASDDILCLVTPDIGNGPLNAVVTIDALDLLLDTSRARSPSPHRGEGRGEGALISLSLDVNACEFNLDWSCTQSWHAPSPYPLPGGERGLTIIVSAPLVTWSPPRPCVSYATGDLARAHARIAAIAHRAAPADGLAPLVFETGSDPAGSDPILQRQLQVLAGPQIAALTRWLSASHKKPPTDLLGLGPGLTPSGDDLLTGVLIALHAVGRSSDAAALGAAIAAEARRATTTLSAAMLECAAEGEAGEPLHLAVNAALDAEDDEARRLVEAAGRVGHSSGWDALAGVALVLRC